MSPSGCQLSQLTQLTTQSTPAPAHSLQSPNFPFPGLPCVLILGRGAPPPIAHGASSAAWGCQHCHLGTMPAGLAGPCSGQFKSAVMES